MFRSWYIFVVLEQKTRRIIHTCVTQSPTDAWTAQQLRQATPWGQGPKYLIRDRESKYATHFSAVAAGSGIKELRTPYRVPQANGICERFMGSLRRECLDQTLIYEGRHLERMVKEYTAYFNQGRLIRVSGSAFLINMSCPSQSRQAGASHPRQFLAGCIIVILVRHI